MANVYAGTVNFVHVRNGWGYIDCPAVKACYGNDVCLPRLEWSGYCAQVGDEVKFTIIRDKRGALEAANVQPRLYQGKLAIWNPHTSCGIIRSDETSAVNDKDIFVKKSDFGMGADDVYQGMWLTFKVKLDGGLRTIGEQRGPAAYDVSWGVWPTAAYYGV